MLNRVLFIVLSSALFFGVGGLLNSARANTPDVIGKWERIMPDLPFFPIHVNLLPDGKVMIFPGDDGLTGNDPRAWDPIANTITSLAKPGYDVFCSGHVSLADGSLFMAGGHVSNFVGLSNASRYNYFTDSWTPLPNMNAGRWYPTTTVLANGDVLTISGSVDTAIGQNTLPQVFETSKGTWRNLTGAQIQLDDYPRMFLAPNGKIFYAGVSPTTRYLDTSGIGSWSFVATRPNDLSEYGSAAMYAPGKIITMGGGQTPVKNTAEVIDLNQPSPSWRSIAPMKYARQQTTATLLPDGKVLVIGGTSASGFNVESGHIDIPEMWDPKTEQWTQLAASSGFPRIYHSTAMLLPDGRVMSTGGNKYPQLEVFSPPYLFKGSRPVITSAPTNITYQTSFSIKTPDAASISKVTIIRLGSVTHNFNMGQVINELSFTATSTGLDITGPANANIASPGYYMLFILNGNGVPSVAKFVKVDAGTAPSVSMVVPEANSTVAGKSVKISAIAEDNVNVIGVQFKLNGNNLGAEVTERQGNTFTYTWDTTANNLTDGTYTITATARDGDGNTRTSAGVSVSVSNSQLLPDLVVTDITYTSQNLFTATVKNQGTAPSTHIGVAYSVDDMEKAWGSKAATLAPGESTTVGTTGFNVPNYTIPSGSHTMTAHVNDTKKVTELDYNNNRLSKPVIGGITDTEAPKVTITSPSTGATISGTNVTFTADATDNIGVAGVQFVVSGAYPSPEDTTAPYSIVFDTTTVVNGAHTITATARDAAGNLSTNVVSIVVSNGAVVVDTEPPKINITSPAGTTVSGASFKIKADVTDNVGVAGVQFSVSGPNAPTFPELTSAPYEVTWDTTKLADGPRTITVVARDKAGNKSTTTKDVTVTNNGVVLMPDVVVTDFSYNNGIFTSVVKNQGNKDTPVGVNIGVGYFVDGKEKTWGTVPGPLASGASVTVGTTGGVYVIPGGAQTMEAFADDMNRFGESDETNNKLAVPVNIVNTKPSVSIVSPNQGNTVAGTVNISANATDNVGVAGVQFRIDGNNVGSEDTQAPYTYSWNTTSATDGVHTISAVARDGDGNTTISSDVSVTVTNSSSTLPDVVVTSLTYNNGIFTSVVKNQGNKATPAGVSIGLAYFVDGVERTWGTVIGPLAAGASVTFGTSGPAYIIPKGTHTIMAHVNDLNRYVESDTTNNKLSQSITIP